MGYDVFYDCKSLTSVVFENVYGWSISVGKGQPVDENKLSDPARAAELLKNTYYEYEWKRV